jgi:hypothetical protein
MKDFFDDLERQLVDAAPSRQARLRRARVRRATAVASILVVLLAGGAGIAAAVGGGEQDGGHGAPAGTTSGDHFTRTALPPASTTTTPADRAAYEVAVLNGTTVPGLARGVAMRLQNDAFKIGTVTNAARQDQIETVVYYRTAAAIPAASEVSSSLRLGDAGGEFSLRAASRGLRTLAGKGAKVIVVVGSDQNNAPRGP